MIGHRVERKVERFRPATMSEEDNMSRRSEAKPRSFTDDGEGAVAKAAGFSLHAGVAAAPMSEVK